jgi:hypothetical protein
LVAGADLHADGTAIIGYPSTRVANGNMTLGAGARAKRHGDLRRLHVGDRFQTGHNVVARGMRHRRRRVGVEHTVIDSGCHIGNRVEIHRIAT